MLQKGTLDRQTQIKREGKMKQRYATTAAHADIPQVDALRKDETKN